MYFKRGQRSGGWRLFTGINRLFFMFCLKRLDWLSRDSVSTETCEQQQPLGSATSNSSAFPATIFHSGVCVCVQCVGLCVHVSVKWDVCTMCGSVCVCSGIFEFKSVCDCMCVCYLWRHRRQCVCVRAHLSVSVEVCVQCTHVFVSV